MPKSTEIYSKVSRHLNQTNQSASEVWERMANSLQSGEQAISQAMQTLETLFIQLEASCKTALPHNKE